MITHDVTIVGAGPVGLATAIFARNAGLSVQVLDGGAIDGDKACGEGLMPGTAPLLAELGIDPPGHALEGVVYHQGSTRVEHSFPEKPGRGVRRTELRDALVQRAHDGGVLIERAKYVSLTQDAHSATVTTDSGHYITSRYVIGCDGLHSSVAADLGVVKKPPRGAKRYGLRQHFAIAPWSSNIEVFYSSNAEVYITPVSSDTVGVAALGPKGVNLDSAIASIPALHAKLAGAQPASTLR
ncbi:FAD-dependent monooxygenase, partial [Pontimonas sp.]|nr:FAD-dependent monooxygenase [Pontimonas sp.]